MLESSLVNNLFAVYLMCYSFFACVLLPTALNLCVSALVKILHACIIYMSVSFVSKLKLHCFHLVQSAAISASPSAVTACFHLPSTSWQERGISKWCFTFIVTGNKPRMRRHGNKKDLSTQIASKSDSLKYFNEHALILHALVMLQHLQFTFCSYDSQS